jgi:hypothetical protein
VLSIRWAVEREEVVPVEDDVGTGLLGFGYGSSDIAVVGVLRLELHANPHICSHPTYCGVPITVVSRHVDL